MAKYPTRHDARRSREHTKLKTHMNVFRTSFFVRDDERSLHRSRAQIRRKKNVLLTSGRKNMSGKRIVTSQRMTLVEWYMYFIYIFKMCVCVHKLRITNSVHVWKKNTHVSLLMTSKLIQGKYDWCHCELIMLNNTLPLGF